MSSHVSYPCISRSDLHGNGSITPESHHNTNPIITSMSVCQCWFVIARSGCTLYILNNEDLLSPESP